MADEFLTGHATIPVTPPNLQPEEAFAQLFPKLWTTADSLEIPSNLMAAEIVVADIEDSIST